MQDLIKKKIDYLHTIEDKETLDFYQGLRTLIKLMYKYNLNILSRVIEEFSSNILSHGVFYIDVINENLIFFLQSRRKQPILQLNLFLLIIGKLISICDQQTIEVLQVFIKQSIGKDDKDMAWEAQQYIDFIEINLSKIRAKVDLYPLHGYKDIIQKW